METDLDNLYEQRFRAMGSEIVIWLEQEDAATAAQLLQQAQDIFNVAEARMTRFDEGSELSKLNRQPGRWVAVSRPLWQVLQEAWQLTIETEGLFDPTLLTAIEAVGYRQPFTEQWAWGAADQPNGIPTSKGQWQQVKRDVSSHSIFLPEGVRIDLGGIGKGFTAQRVVDFLSHWGACMVDAGGDIVAGDAPEGWPGWPVEIAKPWEIAEGEADAVAEVWLNNGALATSGVDYRWWLQAGKRKHHLIDPRTGTSADTDLLTASVLTADGCRAEAWATALLVAGMQPAQQLLQSQGIAAVLIDQFHKTVATPSMQRFLKAGTSVLHAVGMDGGKEEL